MLVGQLLLRDPGTTLAVGVQGFRPLLNPNLHGLEGAVLAEEISQAFAWPAMQRSSF